MTVKQNWFNTLSETLESEGLTELWAKNFPWGEISIQYGETFHKILEIEGIEKYGHLVSIYRDNRGMYERPVHYLTK